MPKLIYLDLSDNQFDGPIPPEIFSIPLLEGLNLGRNRFTGAIPSMARATSLDNLSAEDNRLTALPADLTTLGQLRFLQLSSNELSGNLPAGIGGMANLISLQLSDDHFSGTIPDLSKPANLQSLFLSAIS